MTQDTALSILKTGANVFLTGEPGAGKTYVINQYVAWLEAAGLNVAVTASTGIAATHIGGLTIHSWSGIGARDTLTAQDLDQITTRERLVKRIKKMHVLIIDEISMLDGRLLDNVDLICRTIRGRSEVFGGMQVVCVGDFYQLPPVTRMGDVMTYAFESKAWGQFRPLVCYLTDQFRQEDEMLLSLLSSIRRGEIEEEHYTLLAEQVDIAYEGVEPTRLYTHNADVDAVNATKLAALTTKNKAFTMQSRGNKMLIENLVRNCLSPSTLYLKEEAMVMCTKNNFEAGYVNGTLARVVSFGSNGYPVIETTDKRRIEIEPVSWEIIDDGKVIASIEQLPLRLAWAITVHKSQGMSLDAVEVDLSKAFVYGQGYVALSRVRTLAGLKVLGMSPQALQVDPKVITQDARFKAESDAAEETFRNLEATELHEMHSRFVIAGGGKLPSEGEVKAVGKTKKVLLGNDSTYEETKRLLEKGLPLEALAELRSLTLGTVVAHIEALAEAKNLTPEELLSLTRHVADWKSIYSELEPHLSSLGGEKLRPLYDAVEGKYEYHIIRLARVQFCYKKEKEGVQ